MIYSDVFRRVLVDGLSDDLINKMELIHSSGYLRHGKPISHNKKLTESAIEFLKAMGLNVFAIRVVESIYQKQYATGIHPYGMNYYSLVRFIKEHTSFFN